MKENKSMRNKLVELSQLMELLGCEDERTIVTWCKKNRLPILKMGMKKYTVETFLELFIKDELSKFVSKEYNNAEKIIEAIEQDNKIELAELVFAPTTSKAKVGFKNKSDSKAANEYMKKFKAA